MAMLLKPRGLIGAIATWKEGPLKPFKKQSYKWTNEKKQLKHHGRRGDNCP